MNAIATIDNILQASPVIPVIVIDDLEHAVPMAQALVAGGITVLEVTLRTPVALQAIEKISRAVPEAMTGAGTLLNAGDFARAQSAGARFAVTPGLTPALAEASQKTGLPLLPGAMTPSEIIAAQELGFTRLKFFPAVSAGGIAMLQSFAGPFKDVYFCPTGGITEASAASFLALPNVRCVGGSWLVTKEALAARDWAEIEARARRAVALKR